MIRGVLLDIAGVLLDNGRALPGASDALAQLRAAGLPVRFLTNSTHSPGAGVLRALRDAGLDAAEDELLTPAAAAARSCAFRGVTSRHLDRLGTPLIYGRIVI